MKCLINNYNLLKTDCDSFNAFDAVFLLTSNASMLYNLLSYFAESFSLLSISCRPMELVISRTVQEKSYSMTRQDLLLWLFKENRHE